MRRLIQLWTIAMCALVSSAPAATITFHATVNTAALEGAGTFSINFQFIDGSGLPADLNNNTATLLNFNFGTGGPAGLPSLFNGAAGDLSSTVTLNDVAFFNEFVQDFTPGNLLTFTIQITNNLNPGGVPDQFSFAILDEVGFELPSTGPASEFISITIDSAKPTPQSFGSASGASFSIPAPSVAPDTPTDIPEPGTAGTAIAAMVLFTIGLRRGSAVDPKIRKI